MTTHDKYPYRIFLSYAKKDAEKADQIFKRLRDQQLRPIWDHHTPVGWRFLEQIQKKIDHSHVFMPFLTPNSKRSEWVNHEIGYALGRKVPVLPLSLGPLPDGMARELEAIVARDMQSLLRRMTRSRIKRLMNEAEPAAVYECADLSSTRTDAIIKHCKEVEGFNNNRRQRLRHVAAFGSFSIPEDPNAPIWKQRDPKKLQSPERRERLSKERRKLEAHAKRFGCDLVLYPTLKNLTKKRIQTRKTVMQSFLQRMQEARARVRVTFDKRGLDENLIIVGDWFLVESFTPREDGYRHTTITTHAPTVLKRIEAFDKQFAKCKWLSPEQAIRRLERSFRVIR